MEIDFAEVLKEVVELNASDLHLTVGTPPMVRVRGELRALDNYPPLDAKDTRDIMYGILSNDQRKKLEEDWQVDFSYSVPKYGRFRVNAYMQRASIGGAFRLIPSEIKGIDQLGLPPVIHDIIKKPRGFVLVTGPTGSGKSTSLAAMIDEINKQRREHILTIEDPIEFLHRHKNCVVNQREIGNDAQSFSLGLKAALAPGPRRDSRGRDARPRDDLDRADRGRDRPPRVRDPAHAGHARRRSTASSTCSRRTSSSRCACSCRSRCRASSPSSCCRPPTAPAAWPRARCWC